MPVEKHELEKKKNPGCFHSCGQLPATLLAPEARAITCSHRHEIVNWWNRNTPPLSPLRRRG
jgi:hypothetical protein